MGWRKKISASFGMMKGAPGLLDSPARLFYLE
jgi:hypothetical protein